MRGDWVGRLRRGAGARKVELSLVLLALVALAPIVAEDTAQPASRLALTAALAEHHTVDVGRYPMGIDHAVYEGHQRSDKAPAQPIAAVPVYLIGRAFGVESASHKHVNGNLTLWWVTLWSSVVPFALLLVLMYRMARRFAAKAALPATLALGFATILLPHAVSLYGHTLAALCAFAAFVVVDRAKPTRAVLIGAGVLASSAIAVEYQSVIAALVVFAVVAWRERVRSLWMALGAVPAALVVAVYQQRAFGAWYHTPFNYYAGELNGTTRGGYTLPSFSNLWDIFVGTRGLLWVSPIVLVALGGAIWIACVTTGALRAHALVALTVMGGYVVLCAGWSGTSLLEEPGPRYAIPAIPFLVVPLAAVWSCCRRLALLASAVGALFMVTATFTFLLVQVGHTPIMYLRYARQHVFSPTLWSMAFGPFGVVLYLATIAASGVVLYGAAQSDREDRDAKWNWRLPALCAAPLLVSEVLQPCDLRGYGYTIVAVLLASLLAAAITWSPLQRALSIRSLGWLGLISYSLYLWHYPVIFWLRGSTDGGIYDATVANVVIVLAASIALACASYYLVERRFIRRRATAPEEPAAA